MEKDLCLGEAKGMDKNEHLRKSQRNCHAERHVAGRFYQHTGFNVLPGNMGKCSCSLSNMPWKIRLILKVCTMPWHHSIEGYGFNIYELVKAAGMKYNNGENTVFDKLVSNDGGEQLMISHGVDFLDSIVYIIGNKEVLP